MVAVHSNHYAVCALLISFAKRTTEILKTLVVTPLKTSSPAYQVPSFIAAAAADIYAMESSLYALCANLDIPTQDSLIEAAVVAASIQQRTADLISRSLLVVAEAEPMDQVPVALKALQAVKADATEVLRLTEPEETLRQTAAAFGVEDFGIAFQKQSFAETMQKRTLRSVRVKERLPFPASWKEVSAVEDAIAAFGKAVERVFVRNQAKLVHQHLLLSRLAQALGLIYLSTASLSRALDAEKKLLDTAPLEHQLARAFVSTAAEEARVLCAECVQTGKAADEVYKRVAADVCEGAFPTTNGGA